jgi:hypothetical protein
VHAELDGHDLHRLGVPRGLIYRTILANLRAGRLDGTIHSRAEEEAYVTAFCRDLVRRHQ